MAAANNAFTPTLGQIVEEPSPFIKGRFDDSMLEDYAVLTQRDLLKALDLLDNEEGDVSKVDVFTFEGNTDSTDNVSTADQSEFASLHMGAKVKNQVIIERMSFIPDIDKNSKNKYIEDEMESCNDSKVENHQHVQNELRMVNRKSPDKKDLTGPYSYENKCLFNVCHQHDGDADENFGINFNSNQGRKIFTKAVNHKSMNIYYVLSQQHVQVEKVGTSCLNLVLSALKVTENQQIDLSKEGAFHEFACAAKNSGLAVDVVSCVDKLSGIEDFRHAIKTSTVSEDTIVVCYYTRNNPQMHCDGHFGIVSGYFKEKDYILLSDDVLPSKWLPVEMMWKTLFDGSPEEAGCNSFQGYFILRKPEENPAITMTVNAKVRIKLKSGNDHTLKLSTLNEEWHKWLSSVPCSDLSKESVLSNGINYVISMVKNANFGSVQSSLANKNIKLSYKEDSLVDSVTKTNVFLVVQTILSSLPEEELVKITQFSEWVFEELSVTSNELPKKRKKTKRKEKKSLVETNVNVNLFNNAAMLSVWLIFWPYDDDKCETNSACLAEFISEDVGIFPKATVGLFHQQIRFVLKMLHNYSSNKLDK